MQSQTQAPPRPAAGAGGESAAADPPRRRVYVRTVYALNPGIPHAADFPLARGGEGPGI